LAFLGVPDFHRAVLRRSAEQALPVRAEGHSEDVALVSLAGEQLLARPRVRDFHLTGDVPVLGPGQCATARGQVFAVRAVGDAEDVARVSGEGTRSGVRGQLPDLDDARMRG